MKITVDISEEKIVEMAIGIAAEELSEAIRKGWGEGYYSYRKLCKEVIREAIKENIDDLSDRAVSAAAKSIENKAVKKMLDKLVVES